MAARTRAACTAAPVERRERAIAHGHPAGAPAAGFSRYRPGALHLHAPGARLSPGARARARRGRRQPAMYTYAHPAFTAAQAGEERRGGRRRPSESTGTTAPRAEMAGAGGLPMGLVLPPSLFAPRADANPGDWPGPGPMGHGTYMHRPV